MVEDDDKAADILRSHIVGYEKESGEQFEVVRYKDAVTFLADYHTDTDIVLMDIELPDLSGMDAAHKLRATDPVVTIIFVTNMSQFAIGGYAVGALDFLVKPVGYYAFSTMMTRAVAARSKARDREIAVRMSGGLSRISASSVIYVEVRDHKLIYNTDSGIMEAWGSMRELQKELAAYDFARCNNCWLVNLRRVVAIEGNDVIVGGARLTLSRTYKKDFMRELARHLSETGRSGAQ